jgi:cytochrome b561
MTRYHPILVALHWLIAILIFIALIAGGFVLEHIPNDDPEKIQALGPHMTVGLILLVLMIARLIVRLSTRKPAHAETGNALLDRLGRATHWLFYIAVLGMAGSGMAMSVQAGLPEIVFQGSGAPLPESFWDFPARRAHAAFSLLLWGLIGLHVAAALWHQFIRRDGLFRRMWFGARQP